MCFGRSRTTFSFLFEAGSVLVLSLLSKLVWFATEHQGVTLLHIRVVGQMLTIELSHQSCLHFKLSVNTRK